MGLYPHIAWMEKAAGHHCAGTISMKIKRHRDIFGCTSTTHIQIHRVGSIQKSDLDPIIIEALQAEETRPRSVLMQDGLLVTLRGVNMNPGAVPEDMVSIRVWIDKNRIISTRHRHLLSIDDLRNSIELGQGPKTPGEFLVHLADRLSERMADVINNVDETVDKLEEEVLTSESYRLRARIANVRRETIALRRYLSPQREAMSRLHNERVEWLTDIDWMRLRELVSCCVLFANPRRY